MRNNFLVTFVAVLLSTLLIVTASVTTSPITITRPIKACPAYVCIEQFCEYGFTTTSDENGCPGCRRCLPNPVCPAVMCIQEVCDNGSITPVDANGCAGCPQCLPNAASS